jgi:hypothetical protein
MPPTSVIQQELPVLLSENNSTEYSLEYSCSSLFGHKLNSKASRRPSSMIIQTRNINQTIQNQSFTKDGQSKTLYKQQSMPLILHELSPLVLKYKNN